MEFISRAPSKTQELAVKIGKELINSKPQSTGAVVFSLEGELGAGKTTFVKGLGEYLGIKAVIKSPTFVIAKRFKALHPTIKTLYHLDCYRLEQAEDLSELGAGDFFSDPQALVAIEWGEKVKGILPSGTITIQFEVLGERKRKIVLRNFKNVQ